MKICEYGCGQEAKFQLRNGKWCCSKSQNSCISIKKKFSLGQTGKKQTEETKLKLSIANKGKKVSEEARKKISESRKKYTGENHPLYGKPCSETRRKKISEANKEWNKNNTPIWLGRKHTEESKKKIGLTSLGRKHDEDFKERWRQRCLHGHSQTMNSCPRDPEKIEKFKERQRKWMTNNGKYIRSFISKISKDEIRLANLIKELYPDCELQYPVLNFDVDIALPQYKIAIEFDGYFHFDTEEHKEYHKLRQEKIENEGWKFYRVTIFDKFPTLEEVKEKIEVLINEG